MFCFFGKLEMSWWKDGNVTVILLQSAKNVNMHLVDVPPAKWYRSKLRFCLLHPAPTPTPTPTPVACLLSFMSFHRLFFETTL